MSYLTPKNLNKTDSYGTENENKNPQLFTENYVK